MKLRECGTRFGLHLRHAFSRPPRSYDECSKPQARNDEVEVSHPRPTSTLVNLRVRISDYSNRIRNNIAGKQIAALYVSRFHTKQLAFI